MHESYTTEDGKIKRHREHEEEEIEPGDALKKYRGLVLRIKDLREELDQTLAREEALRPAIQDLIDEVEAEAETIDDVDESIIEDAESRLREARLAVQRVDEARERANQDEEEA